MTFQNIVIQSKDDREDFRAFLHCTDTAGFAWELRGYGKTAGEAADDAWRKYKAGEDTWENTGVILLEVDGFGTVQPN